MNLRDALGAPDPADLLPVTVPASLTAAVTAAVDALDVDCPEWLPADPAVPWHLRTPCALDARHRGPCDPVDATMHGRALLLLRTGQLRPMDAQDAQDARAAYRGNAGANATVGSLHGFLEGYVAGWASAWARNTTQPNTEQDPQ